MAMSAISSAAWGFVGGAMVRWVEFDLEGKVRTVPPARTLSPRASIAFPFPTAHSPSCGTWKPPGRATMCFPASGLAARFPAWRSKCCYAASARPMRRTASAARSATGRATKPIPRELAEHALAHVTGDRAEQAYRRSDALARRRELMDAWAKHCEGAAGDNVVTFKRQALA